MTEAALLPDDLKEPAMSNTVTFFEITTAADSEGRTHRVAARVSTEQVADTAAHIIGDGWGGPAAVKPVTLVIADTLDEIGDPAVKNALAEQARAADPEGYARFLTDQARFGGA